MPNNYEAIQDENQKNAANPDGQGQSTGAGPAATPTSGTSRVSSFSSGVQPTQSGSGRFTNLQNYIGANKGASDRLASGISSNLEKANEPVKKEAQTQATNVRDGIQSAQGKLATGETYLNQIEKPDFDASSIAGDQNKLQDFTQYRTNKAVDANQLSNQVNQAQTTTQNLQGQLQQQMKNASSEQGRFNLLKNTFGGGSVYQNPYSTGQQRLDQLFLQAGGNDNVNKIQTGIRSNLAGSNQLLNTLGQDKTSVQGIATKASDIAQGLQTGTTGLTNNLVSGIEATKDQVNAQRTAEQKWADTQYKNLQSGAQIDQRFAQMMGLNGGQNIYNTLSDKNAETYLKYGATELQDANQLANAQQRQKYSALAQLAGIDQNSYAIRNDYTPEAAVGLKSDRNLLSDVAARRAEFDAKKYYTAAPGSYLRDSNLTGAQIGQVLDNRGVEQTEALIRAANQNPLGWDGTNTEYWNLMQSVAGNHADTQMSNNALLEFMRNGYFNGVNVAPPSDTEKGGNFGVT